GWQRVAGSSWGPNVAVDGAAGDEGEKGGRAVERSGGQAVEHHEVRFLPDFDRADRGLESECTRALEGEHAARGFALEARGDGLTPQAHVAGADDGIRAEAHRDPRSAERGERSDAVT